MWVCHGFHYDLGSSPLIIKIFEIFDYQSSLLIISFTKRLLTNLTVKVLTNCHNLLGNPLYGPIWVLWRYIPHRIKIRSGRVYIVGLLSLC
jgi:hypothetical protein